MNDFGNEVGSTALNAGSQVVTKLLEAVMSFFKHLFKLWETHPERKMAKERLRGMEDEKSRKKFLEKIEGRAGYLKFKEMEKAGIKCTAIGVTMSKEEMQDFSHHCKREGIKFTAMMDKNELENQSRLYNILCPVDELENVKRLIDRMNDEKLIKGIDKRIEEIENKEDFSEQDKVDVENLRLRKEELKRSYCEALNEQQSKNIWEKAISGKVLKDISFDNSIDRYTGKELDRSQFSIICDPQNPSKHIKCYGDNDIFRGQTYIKTEYQVYNGNELVYKTDDRRFEGRSKSYWFEEKNKMKELGGFSDTVFKFYTIEEYERWAENAKTQNEVELASFKYKGEEGRNYLEISNKLKEQLKKNGFEYKEGALIDKVTGKPPLKIISNDMRASEKSNIAESFTIIEQIINYNELDQIEGELAIANSIIVTTEEGTKEHEEALKNYEEINERYEMALDTEKALKEERMNINGVQAKEETNNGRVDAQIKTEILNDVKSKFDYSDNAKKLYENEVIQTVGYHELNNQVAENSRITNAIEIEKGVYEFNSSDFEKAEEKFIEITLAQKENKRAERVEEIDDTKREMTEYKGEIQHMKNKEGAKKNDLTLKEKDKVNIKPSTKDKGDR